VAHNADLESQNITSLVDDSFLFHADLTAGRRCTAECPLRQRWGLQPFKLSHQRENDAAQALGLEEADMHHMSGL
jgi:hypothetical protein